MTHKWLWWRREIAATARSANDRIAKPLGIAASGELRGGEAGKGRRVAHLKSHSV